MKETGISETNNQQLNDQKTYGVWMRQRKELEAKYEKQISNISNYINGIEPVEK